jgi:hypothetical protein
VGKSTVAALVAEALAAAADAQLPDARAAAQRPLHPEGLARWTRTRPPTARPRFARGWVVVFVASYFSSTDVSMSFLQLAITIARCGPRRARSHCRAAPPTHRLHTRHPSV